MQHYWIFGDGTGNTAGAISPMHTYASPGTYYVKHYVVRHNASGTLVCTDTLTKVLTIYLDCNIQAYFTSVPDSANAYKINFANQTVNFNASDSIRWTFGDGTVSYDVNPSHTYANAGTYNVCLRVKRNATAPGTTPCVSEICKTVTIAASTACTLHVDYSWHADSLTGNKIYFTNLSSPLASIDSIRWTFGDGASSNQVNPVHLYTTAGTYTVCLRIIKRTPNGALTNCIKDTCYAVTVQNNVCNLTASFVSYKDSLATSPYTYYFQNTSAPLSATDSIRWTFGDGTTSGAVNPTHTYAQSGTYTVCLRVIKRDPAGTLSNCIKETCSSIVVTQTCNIQPNFSWIKDSINNRKIYFTNLTAASNTGITFTWNFGDGSTATSYNAAHEYAQPGRYYVCLRAAYGNCVTYKCDSVTVSATAPACTQLSNYSYIKSATDNQLYSFKPDYVGTDVQYTWTFGDGAGTHDPVTTHHFALGVYNVCLTAFRNTNCAATTCKTITVLPQINCDSVHVYFSDSRDSLTPNRVTFTASASQLILDQVWTITTSSATGSQVILHQNNPTYIFADTGYYNVCLKVTTTGGCIKTYCKNIYIGQLGSNACELQAYPNPTTNLVNVNVQLSQPQTIYVYLYNSLNLLLATKTQAGVAGNNIVTLSTGNLAAGLYTIKFVYGNKVCYARFQKF